MASTTSESMFDKYGVSFNKGELIFCEYEPGDDLYMIQSGEVQVVKIVEDKEKALDKFGPGDIFGEMAILEQAPRSASAVAIEPVKALKFNRENFEVLLQSHPQIGLKILRNFCTRIFEAKRRLMILSFDDTDSRILDSLMMLAEKKNCNFEAQEPFELETNEEDIAKWCAIKVDECSRSIKGLTKMGRINVSPGKIIIKNPVELHRVISNRRKILAMKK